MNYATSPQDGGKTGAGSNKSQRLPRGSIPLTERPKQVREYKDVDAAGHTIYVIAFEDGREMEISKAEFWFDTAVLPVIFIGLVSLAVWFIFSLFTGDDDSGSEDTFVPSDRAPVVKQDRDPSDCEARYNSLTASQEFFTFREYRSMLWALEAECGRM